jgi:hypothetical protein
MKINRFPNLFEDRLLLSHYHNQQVECFPFKEEVEIGLHGGGGGGGGGSDIQFYCNEPEVQRTTNNKIV